MLWFAQNSLPLRWQRQLFLIIFPMPFSCDLLKIHYLCGDKDNKCLQRVQVQTVVICSKFITFAVTKTTGFGSIGVMAGLWFAQNSLPLRWQRQQIRQRLHFLLRCDLLKIHYLCGDKDNIGRILVNSTSVVICSKFITFAVTKTTSSAQDPKVKLLWFAQNSLPLRWQRQHRRIYRKRQRSCDLLKIHYLCGDKDNHAWIFAYVKFVVICSKFITFAVTKTTLIWYLADNQSNVECVRNKNRRCLKRRTHG